MHGASAYAAVDEAPVNVKGALEPACCCDLHQAALLHMHCPLLAAVNLDVRRTFDVQGALQASQNLRGATRLHMYGAPLRTRQAKVTAPGHDQAAPVGTGDRLFAVDAAWRNLTPVDDVHA